MTELSIAGLKIKLAQHPGVFLPTTCTHMLTEGLDDLRGKAVLDLGCGVGPIAIAAALGGAEKVCAVDIMEEACRAAKTNAELNGVLERIDVRRGDLFEPVEGLKFDVIVADVSGMAAEVARVSPWYPDPVPTGGPDGTVPTVRMLAKSREHLKDGGYLLFPALGLARVEKILSAAHEAYGEKLRQVAEKMIPFCRELMENLGLLDRLQEKGIIRYVKRRSRYLWSLAIYRADT